MTTFSITIADKVTTAVQRPMFSEDRGWNRWTGCKAMDDETEIVDYSGCVPVYRFVDADGHAHFIIGGCAHLEWELND